MSITKSEKHKNTYQPKHVYSSEIQINYDVWFDVFFFLTTRVGEKTVF